MIFSTQLVGDACTDTNAGTNCNGNHQILYRICYRNSVESILTYSSDKDAVDDVIHGLNQHGRDQG